MAGASGREGAQLLHEQPEGDVADDGKRRVGRRIHAALVVVACVEIKLQAPHAGEMLPPSLRLRDGVRVEFHTGSGRRRRAARSR